MKQTLNSKGHLPGPIIYLFLIKEDFGTGRLSSEVTVRQLSVKLGIIWLLECLKVLLR